MAGRRPETLSAGRVGKPHGLDGSFHVTRPRPALLTGEIPLSVAGERREVVRRAGTDAEVILRLEGCTTREAAEALRGEDLVVAIADAPPLEEGEFWAEELAGLLVFDGDREVGEVVRMLSYPSCELLEVRRPGGGELLVPMVADAVREIDIAANRVDVDLAFMGEE